MVRIYCFLIFSLCVFFSSCIITSSQDMKKSYKKYIKQGMIVAIPVFGVSLFFFLLMSKKTVTQKENEEAQELKREVGEFMFEEVDHWFLNGVREDVPLEKYDENILCDLKEKTRITPQDIAAFTANEHNERENDKLVGIIEIKKDIHFFYGLSDEYEKDLGDYCVWNNIKTYHSFFDHFYTLKSLSDRYREDITRPSE